MAVIIIRCAIIYILLNFSIRIMGKRQIGELDVGDLVSTLIISELAAIPISDPDIPLLFSAVPILFIISAEILISALKNRFNGLKRAVEGSPAYIIYKGRLLQKALKDNRISLNELLSEMRTQGIGDIEEIYYAAIEQNGSLSILKKGESSMAHAIIIDGNLIKNNLKAHGYDERWLAKRLKEAKVRQNEVYLMSVNDEGQVSFIIKEDE